MDYDQKGITERILLTAKLLGLSDTELSKEIGVQRQFINNINKNITTIPPKRAVIFLSLHKEIDARWLFFNEGEMLVKPSTEGNHKFFIDNSGDMEFTTTNNTEGLYQEKYKNLVSFLNEKDKHINGMAKTIEAQNQFIEKILSKD